MKFFSDRLFTQLTLGLGLVLALTLPSPVLATKPAAPAASQRPQAAPNAQKLMAELKLTDKQKTDLLKADQERRSKIQELLTPEQRKAIAAGRQAGQSLQTVMQTIKLTAQQKTQLQQIAQTHRQKVQSILTPEQRKLLKDRLEQLAGSTTP
jgi:Spy/CpxP family protein refolding chaperone